MTATGSVIDSVSMKMQIGKIGKIKMRKLRFCLRSEIDKPTLHRKPRKKFAEDGRSKAYGSLSVMFPPHNDPCIVGPSATQIKSVA